MPSRGKTLAAVFVLCVLGVDATAAHGSSNPRVAIVKSNALAQFEAAVGGLVESLRHTPLQPELLLFDLKGDARRAPEIIAEVRDANPELIVTVGSLATRMILDSHPSKPVVFSMVLYPEQSGFATAKDRDVTGVSLDIPIEAQFRFLRRLLPNARKVGILYNPTETGRIVNAAAEAAKGLGFTLVAEVVGETAEAAPTLERTIEHVDAIWAVADSHVFTPSTTAPLILSTLRHRVPLFGLSAAQVQGGALAALTCDYTEVGRQAADLVQLVLAGKHAGSLPVQPPRKYGIALNLRTAEHLGLHIDPGLVQDATEVFK